MLPIFTVFLTILSALNMQIVLRSSTPAVMLNCRCVQVPAATCLASTRHQWQYSRLNQHCQQEVRGSVHQVLFQPHWKCAQVISNLKKKIVPDQVLDGPDPHQPQKK